MASLLSSASTSSELTVVVPPTIHCGGGFVEGEVLLNFRQLQEENFDEVCVELSGDIHTCVLSGPQNPVHPILRLDSGAAYPQPDTDVLHLPFRFPLPDGLPPFFHFRIWEINTSILYAINTTGVRRGKFKVNKKVHTPIMVLPKDEAGVGVRMGLGAGVGPGSYTRWKDVWAEEKIRKGIWGEHATARVMASIPDIPVLPLFTPLPFLITITTMTPPMTRAKALSHPQNKPIFPAPPQSHTDIHFCLCRNLVLCPEGFLWTAYEVVASFFGAGTIAQDVVADVEVAEKEWHPEAEEIGAGGRGGEMGRWVQRASFSSKFTLNVPTFSAPSLAVNYYLSLKVPFPGMGNDMLLKVPVTITSGLNQPWLKSDPNPESQPQLQPQCQAQAEPKSESQAASVGGDTHSEADVPASSVYCHSPTRDLGLPPYVCFVSPFDRCKSESDGYERYREYWEAESERDGGRLDP
ncbi:hypothetical protein LXA43DRAFT_905447 [Ganoderma leucocontextum]|nr:hypothetical protein LXA43DRAFT_905447 [Ganoderma leucocontextum]